MTADEVRDAGFNDNGDGKFARDNGDGTIDFVQLDNDGNANGWTEGNAPAPDDQPQPGTDPESSDQPPPPDAPPEAPPVFDPPRDNNSAPADSVGFDPQIASDPLLFPPPPVDNYAEPPPAEFDPPQPVAFEPIINSDPLLLPPAPVDQGADLTTSSPAAAAYAESRPDLAANWQNAFSQDFAGDPVAQYIRGFGTFQAYLENDAANSPGDTRPPPVAIEYTPPELVAYTPPAPPIAPPYNFDLVAPPLPVRFIAPPEFFAEPILETHDLPPFRWNDDPPYVPPPVLIEPPAATTEDAPVDLGALQAAILALAPQLPAISPGPIAPPPVAIDYTAPELVAYTPPPQPPPVRPYIFDLTPQLFPPALDPSLPIRIAPALELEAHDLPPPGWADQPPALPVFEISPALPPLIILPPEQGIEPPASFFFPPPPRPVFVEPLQNYPVREFEPPPINVDGATEPEQTPEIQPAASPAPINSSPMTFDQAVAQFPGLYSESDRDQFNQAQAAQQALNTIANNAPVQPSAAAIAALATIATLPQGAQDLFDLGGTGYGSANSIAQNITPTLPEFGVTMPIPLPPVNVTQTSTAAPAAATTSAAAAAYAASRPDLLANWQNAFAPGNDADPVAQYIRSFGTFQAYLENDAGHTFPADNSTAAPVSISSTMPPLTTTSAAAAAYAQSRPDLAANWQNAFSQSFATDPVAQWIRGFPSFQAYLEQDHGGPFTTAQAGGITGGGAGGAVLPPIQTNGGGVILPGAGVSPLFDPTHRLVGYTRQGFEVYRLTDEGGRLVEWYDIPGQGATGKHYLNGANDPASYLYSATRPGGGGGGGVNAGGGGGGGGSSGNSKTLLILGLAAAAAFYFGRERK